MTLIDEIREDKQKLADTIAGLVRAYEDKYGCLKVTEIKPYRCTTTGPYYGDTFIEMAIKIEGI